MDTASVLDKYTQDLSNLPSEVRFLLEELRNKDTQLQEVRKRWQSRDAQLHKAIKQGSTLQKHPKEAQINQKIDEDQKTVNKLQQEKVLLANSALFLVSKHLFAFEADIAKLEADDLLPPESAVFVDEYKSEYGVSDSGLSGSATPRTNTPVNPTDPVRRSLKRKMGRTMGSRLKRRLHLDDDDDDDLSRFSAGSFALTKDEFDHPHSGPGDDADNNLYCFCQRVSFGEMIGCDNDDCKYEWFHWSCVGITSPPKDDEVWYCPDCSPKMEKRKKKRKVV
ncbi:chromatin modification-related protein Yng2p [Diutina catenulata]